MSGTISSITSSALAATALAAKTASSTGTTDGTGTSAKIACLTKAIEDSVSIISGIVNPDSVSGSGSATYDVLLAAKSEGIMKGAPTFLRDVIAAGGSGEGAANVNAVTMDTETLVSVLENSAS